MAARLAPPAQLARPNDDPHGVLGSCDAGHLEACAYERCALGQGLG